MKHLLQKNSDPIEYIDKKLKTDDFSDKLFNEEIVEMKKSKHVIKPLNEVSKLDLNGKKTNSELNGVLNKQFINQQLVNQTLLNTSQENSSFVNGSAGAAKGDQIQYSADGRPKLIVSIELDLIKLLNMNTFNGHSATPSVEQFLMNNNDANKNSNSLVPAEMTHDLIEHLNNNNKNIKTDTHLNEDTSENRKQAKPQTVSIPANNNKKSSSHDVSNEKPSTPSNFDERQKSKSSSNNSKLNNNNIECDIYV